jgi:hypothetical protein
MEGADKMTAQEAIEDFYNMIIRSIDNAPDYIEKREALEAAGVLLEKIEVHLYVDRKSLQQPAKTDAQFLQSLRIAPDLTVSDRQERP